MNKSLWIVFLVIVPVLTLPAADSAQGALAKKSFKEFNFATDPVELFPFNELTDRFPKERAEEFKETLSWVVLLAKLQKGLLDDDIIAKIHDCPDDDFFKPVLKQELILKKIAEDPTKLNDFDEKSYQEDDELSRFIHRHCSKKDIKSFKQRARAELEEVEDLPKGLGKLAEDDDIPDNPELQEKHNHLKSLQFILKFEEKRKKIKSYNRLNAEHIIDMYGDRAVLAGYEYDMLNAADVQHGQSDRIPWLEHHLIVDPVPVAPIEQPQAQPEERNWFMRFIGNLFMASTFAVTVLFA